MANKEELFQFLDQHVFEPILRANPDHYAEKDRSMLANVQQKTKTERDRYQHYPNAEKIRQMYEDDLHSENAKSVNEHLRHLKLPILADVKTEFLKRADQ